MVDLLEELCQLEANYAKKISEIQEGLREVYRESRFREVVLEIAKGKGVSEEEALDAYLDWSSETGIHNCEVFLATLQEGGQ